MILVHDSVHHLLLEISQQEQVTITDRLCAVSYDLLKIEALQQSVVCVLRASAVVEARVNNEGAVRAQFLQTELLKTTDITLTFENFSVALSPTSSASSHK